jgi:XapX domain-containing protein
LALCRFTEAHCGMLSAGDQTVRHLQPYIISLIVGLGIGVIYGLVSVRSPAPPIIALLGLLGMLAGESWRPVAEGPREFCAGVFA